MPGLDPGIQVLRRPVDGRVKPGHDKGGIEPSDFSHQEVAMTEEEDVDRYLETDGLDSDR